MCTPQTGHRERQYGDSGGISIAKHLPTHDTGMVWENRHILGATVDPVAGIAFIMTGQAYKMAQQVKALGEGEN